MKVSSRRMSRHSPIKFHTRIPWKGISKMEITKVLEYLTGSIEGRDKVNGVAEQELILDLTRRFVSVVSIHEQIFDLYDRAQKASDFDEAQSLIQEASFLRSFQKDSFADIKRDLQRLYLSKENDTLSRPAEAKLSEVHKSPFRGVDTSSVHGADTPFVREADSPSVREADTPSVSEVDNPSVREVDTPSVREVDTPSVREVDTPSVCEVDTPSVHEVDTPSVREVDTPLLQKVDAPSVCEVDTPYVYKIQQISRDIKNHVIKRSAIPNKENRDHQSVEGDTAQEYEKKAAQTESQNIDSSINPCEIVEMFEEGEKSINISNCKESLENERSLTSNDNYTETNRKSSHGSQIQYPSHSRKDMEEDADATHKADQTSKESASLGTLLNDLTETGQSHDRDTTKQNSRKATCKMRWSCNGNRKSKCSTNGSSSSQITSPVNVLALQSERFIHETSFAARHDCSDSKLHVASCSVKAKVRKPPDRCRTCSRGNNEQKVTVHTQDVEAQTDKDIPRREILDSYNKSARNLPIRTDEESGFVRLQILEQQLREKNDTIHQLESQIRWMNEHGQENIQAEMLRTMISCLRTAMRVIREIMQCTFLPLDALRLHGLISEAVAMGNLQLYF